MVSSCMFVQSSKAEHLCSPVLRYTVAAVQYNGYVDMKQS